jgi:elongator complex protein 1
MTLDAPINVGWGSKQTQFHGSLGKAAAQAPSVRAVGSSPDDDAMPRLSWRGDGAFFVVSSLSPASDAMRHRTLRVYDRQAALQSTSEAVPGLEHATVWRPSGNLIVGTQRFGFEGGGAGKEGRHDVVFFERNGLRHGEFGVKVGDLSIAPGPREEGRKWGYKVKELSWSSDSNVLGLWIEKDEGDICEAARLFAFPFI